jgi:hypothetical protein
MDFWRIYLAAICLVFLVYHDLRVESKPSKPANITRGYGSQRVFLDEVSQSSHRGTSPHHMALSENGKYMKIPSLLVIFMEKMMMKQWTEWAFFIFSPYSKPCLTRSKSETGSRT